MSFKEKSPLSPSIERIKWYYPAIIFTFILFLKNFHEVDKLISLENFIIEIGLVVSVFVFCKWKELDIFSFKNKPLKTGFLSYLLLAPWTLLFFVPTYFLLKLFGFDLNQVTAPISEEIAQLSMYSIDFLAFSMIALLLGPFFEEVAFRGIIQGYLRRYFNPIFAIAITSLGFAYLHVENQLNTYFFLKMALSFGFSVCCGLLMESKKSVVPCVVFHGTNNAIPLIVKLFV
ncbi:CPBP family intramembrane metalloprotease [Chlamydiales bacterium]|nr:CPBP family intramembrane metalloprotease [Chlamydiales bacterium]